MKKFLSLSIAMLIVLSSVGCVGPVKLEQIVEIQPHETAYMVALEGDTNENQKKFMSIEYLEKSKVATKRVSLPQRQIKTGRFGHQYKWIPTAKIIKVNRSPVTREWTPDASTGTSSSDQAIWVESKDSIGFAIGVNVTALIKEEDASKFLYYLNGQPLSSVIDTNVRGAAYSILSREFGARNLQQCKTDKKDIAEITESELLKKFEPMGITITNFGLVGGLQYEDKEIQQSINEAYTSEMDVEKAKQEKLAQDERNKMKIAIAKAEKEAALEFAQAQDAMIAKVKLEIERVKAEALKIASERWDGQTPERILPQGSSFLFGLDENNN